MRRGAAVRIIDKEERPHPHSKAIVIWPRTLEIFRRLGLSEQIVERGVRLPAANYYSGGRRVMRVGFRSLKGARFLAPLSLPQQVTEGVLRQELRRLGGEVEYGRTLVSLSSTTHTVHAETDGPTGRQQIEAQWLVGCDGAHSSVRDLSGIGFHGLTYPQTFLLADGVCDTPLAHNEAHYFMTDRGVLVVVGLPNDQYRVFAGVSSHDESSDPIQVLQQAADERSPVPVRIRPDARTGVFRVHARQAESFRTQRILLAGDAAHIHSPAGGQGLNTAVEDAHELGWRLALKDSKELEEEVTRWATERGHVAAEVVAEAHRQTRMWMMPGWKGRVRDAALWLSERTGLAHRVLPPRMARLRHTHPGHGARYGRLVPGRRVPDLPLGGQPLVRVHDLLDDGLPVLLVLASHTHEVSEDLPERLLRAAQPSRAAERWRRVVTVRRPEDAARHGLGPQTRVIADPSGLAHRAMRVKGAVAVSIRPDGVVDNLWRVPQDRLGVFSSRR
jgi:2-polyprenyl-6-methoxyphenol hydroxylase-like FAD-dependent oxidoreductase